MTRDFGGVLATAPYLVAMTVVAVLFIGAMILAGVSFLASRARNRNAARALEAALRNGTDQAALLATIRETPISVLVSDDALRREVDDVLATIDVAPVTARNATPGQDSAGGSTADLAAPRLPKRMTDSRGATSERAYATIDATLAKVPPTIPEDDANPPQKRCMESLAEALAPMQEPFRSWSKRFKDAAEDLGSVVPMREKLPELLNTPLRAKAHFDVDFYEGVNEVRARANDRDDLASGAAIEKLVASVTGWVQLTEDWYSLRKDAAARISHWGGWDVPWHGWLKHVAVRFVDPETESEMVWWQSGLLSRSDSLVRLSAWIVREIDDRIKDRKWREADFSAICSMSSTGVPLATLVSAHFRKRLLVVDEGADFHFPPGFEPKQDDHILMVDSNISTGMHLARCTRRINDAGAFVMGAVLICKDDLPHKAREPIIETLESEDRLIRLFTLSDIYQEWKASRV
ncbi:MAG: phosphoribosyltransferase [Actinomycetota bacterium]|nr:phosphoribosyltransferase [Actinomycetota bacterium]